MTNNVNRVEVIDEQGRRFTRHDIDQVAAVLQDDGQTLKIFLNWFFDFPDDLLKEQ